MSELYEEHRYLLDAEESKLSDQQGRFYQRVFDKDINQAELEASLRHLIIFLSSPWEKGNCIT